MAIQEVEPQAEPQPPQIAIWQIYEDGETSHHLVVNGYDTGRIDWDENEGGTHGAIDGLDGEEYLNYLGIRKLAWLPIASCMSEIHPRLAEMTHLDGSVHVGDGFFATPVEDN